jgi:hypothetical protein
MGHIGASVMGAISLFIRSAQLRSRAFELTMRSSVVTEQLRAEMDSAVLTRSHTRQLLEQGARLDELRQQSEAGIYRRVVYFGQLIDAEICEDQDLLSELNALDCECNKCGECHSIVAAIRFESTDTTLALCAECFQGLTRLSLGQVT